jgi:serine/threonine-protein kinase
MYGAIAAGGMASVHIGRLVAAGGFTRRVAIKRLHPQLASDPEIAATFADEARVAARVAHANVAAMLDVVSADGELLLVMEYVHGEALSRLLARSRAAGAHVPVPIATSVVADLLHGVHAAHEATDEDGTPLRLVHRDVSPQNVIVGVDGVARVVDFGIAKALTRSQVTRDGQLKGKLPYMAPEQLLQRAIDRRVDVYAAGVILWEALAGRRLFDGDQDTVFSRIVEEPVPPPSHVDPSVPRSLDAIVMRALERDPDRRFGTAQEMARALEAAVPSAAASAVAEWVTTTATEALAKRVALIAEMERAARQEDEAATPAVRAPSASVIFRDAAAPPPQGPRRGQRARAGFVVGAALGAAVAGVYFLAFPRLHPSADAAPLAAPAAAPAPPPAVPSEPASAIAAPPPPPASSAPAPVKVAATIPSHGASLQWCKVFDPNKRIFVMKPMRVARCP